MDRLNENSLIDPVMASDSRFRLSGMILAGARRNYCLK